MDSPARRPFPLDATLTLALRSIRHPSGPAAALSAIAGHLAARASAAFLVNTGSNRVELLASAGLKGSDAGPRGVAGPEQASFAAARARDTELMLGCPAGCPEPWASAPHVASIATPIGGTLVCVVAVSSDGPIDPAALRRGATVVSVLAGSTVQGREIDRLQRQVRELSQNRTLMAAGLQHDLRAALGSIVTCTQTLRLRQGALSPEQSDDLLAIVEAQADRLTDMVEQTLVRENGSYPRLTRADLHAVAVRAAEAARMGRPGAVRVSVPHVRITTDPRRVERALLNLLDNALRYAPPGHAVHLVGERGPDSVTLTVADQGPGVASDVIPMLFSPYATDREEGSGLGLHSASQLARELGGTLAYARQDSWTRFSLTLPDVHTEHATAPHEDKTTEEAR